ncbi:site-specific integrase [Desulfopila aestuarii]|uniref:Phage integrase family protein n=1 Tax=Desulfopila aestuarii DSM 18488 TaxID=1121416 RepID=A0A1M7Y8K6_9BACT|nr:site-specific integrase [Desulfopila aestuarii]SHO48974.1 Phage integrase family protein [Desulfopila aestuarii DSM 18488]
MSIRQRQNGTFKVEFRKGRDPERPNSTSRTFKTIEAAERFEATLPDRRGNPPATGPTFHELASAYVVAKVGSMSVTDQDNTYYKLENVILPRFGDLPATAINHSKLDKYVISRLQDTVKVNLGNGRRKDTGRPISKSTIHRELSIVRAILNWGVRRRMLLASPMAGYEMPKRDDKKILPPTEEEFSAILKHAAPHCRRLILISYYTGLRPGREEAYGITWDHVDLDTGTITIISAKKGGIPTRVVPIHPDLAEHLHQWKKEDQENLKKDKTHLKYVIHWNHRPIKTSMKTAWSAAKKRAGITRPLRPYSLRHKSISDMLSAGGDVGAVAEIVGHADPQMTLKVYQETNTAIKQAAIGGLGRTKHVLQEENIYIS